MNKIEYLLSELERIVEKATKEWTDENGDFIHDSYRWVIEPLEKKIAFFKWLLEEKEEEFYCELHVRSIKPTVWRDDVTYSVDIQVHGPSLLGDKPRFSSYDTATILVFRYPERKVE